MKNNKKGFTLIELLAVIIILGILLLVAIPSVTTYISDSRRRTYIITAKQYISSGKTLVNGLDNIFDVDTTYYIPKNCLKVESGGESPYGAFTSAYVAVTYNGESFDYYWGSNDTSNMGVTITLDDLLDPSLVVANSKDVDTSVGINLRNKVRVMDESTCQFGDEKTAGRSVVNTADHEKYTYEIYDDLSYNDIEDFEVYYHRRENAGYGHNSFKSTFTKFTNGDFGLVHYSGPNGVRKLQMFYHLPKVTLKATGENVPVKGVVAIYDGIYKSMNGDEHLVARCEGSGTRGQVECSYSKSDDKIHMCVAEYSAYCYSVNMETYLLLGNGEILNLRDVFNTGGKRTQWYLITVNDGSGGIYYPVYFAETFRKY